MIRYASALMILASLWATPGRAADEPSASDPCAAAIGSNLQDLEAQRLSLERAVAASKSELDAVSSANDRTTESLQRLEDQQTKLIDILYRIECFRTDFERSQEVMRGSPATLSLPLFYATNRRTTDSNQLDDFYGSDDTRQLTYGTTTVSIPSLHRPGELELPSLWKLEWRSDPDRHFEVKAVTPLSHADAQARIGADLSKAKSKSLLLFVHGYNVNFLEASYRTAQLAYDLRFPGIAMFFSWPSAGRTAGYLHDEESSHLAVTIFDQLLDDLASQKFEEIYIIAHSMGNRVVAGTLAERVRNGKDVSKIREVMLAAPDINVEIFKTEIAPLLADLTKARKTIYASSQDIALKASNVVHGFARVGDTRGGVFIYPGFDTIDASAAAPLLRSFGHSYVLDSTVVLNDVEDVIMWHRPLSDRVLRTLGVAPNLYWALR